MIDKWYTSPTTYNPDFFMAYWYIIMKSVFSRWYIKNTRLTLCYLSTPRVGTADNSSRFGESCAAEVVVLGRLFIAKSRAKCDRRRDYDRRRRRRRRCSSSRRAATLLSQTKEVPCSPSFAPCPFVSFEQKSHGARARPRPAREGEVAAAAATLIPSPITHPGVCDSCFVVVALPPSPSSSS